MSKTAFIFNQLTELEKEIIIENIIHTYEASNLTTTSVAFSTLMLILTSEITFEQKCMVQEFMSDENNKSCMLVS